MEMDDKEIVNVPQLQIRLFTLTQRYAVPDTPLSVPATITAEDLNKLLIQLLSEVNLNTCGGLSFDFLVNNQLLRLPLNEHLKEYDISTESQVDIEYIEKIKPPDPLDSLQHNDWVSSVHTCNERILTGCYDYSVNIWNINGTLMFCKKHHSNLVKSVRWINSESFVSVSHDCTGLIWQINAKNELVPMISLRGHERGVDSVAVAPNSLKLATGGWDSNLKIWTSEIDQLEPATKKPKTSKNDIIVSRTPLHTLKGHKECISSLTWLDDYNICTASMDHTIKLWDAELCGMKSEIIGQKAFLSISWSTLNQTLLTTSADRHIRLYDPRNNDKDGTLCKLNLTSHTMWVSSICWSNYDRHLFVSGSYDKQMKMWDIRSCKTPLYNFDGHDGQVMCVDWSNDQYLVSGGCDNRVLLFRNTPSI